MEILKKIKEKLGHVESKNLPLFLLGSLSIYLYTVHIVSQEQIKSYKEYTKLEKINSDLQTEIKNLHRGIVLEKQLLNLCNFKEEDKTRAELLNNEIYKIYENRNK